jgi:hypothetical protein
VGYVQMAHVCITKTFIKIRQFRQKNSYNFKVFMYLKNRNFRRRKIFIEKIFI